MSLHRVCLQTEGFPVCLCLSLASSLYGSATSCGVFPVCVCIFLRCSSFVCIVMWCLPHCLSTCGVFPTVSVFTSSHLSSKGSCLFMPSHLLTAAVLWGEGPPVSVQLYLSLLLPCISLLSQVRRAGSLTHLFGEHNPSISRHTLN